ncbi:hypothetical protein AX16_009397 [Volvariella volvacea WC 439]|nr:hypothetical protein AX16_009397 [Volvariella volvacea WC 439]
MSLLHNLLEGKGPFELANRHDMTGESGLSHQFSQTTRATLYTIASPDSTKIRILDTPGLADTRGIDQDNKHKAEINRAIKESISSVDAVLIMANGTVERLGVATDYTLNVITSMFPASIIDNIGFIFMNADPLTFNFKRESLPPELRQSKRWIIQNPLALYKNYLDQKKAIETLNGFMKWLDERKVQPTKEINSLYQMSVSIESNIEAAISAITRLTERREEMEKIKSGLGNTEKSKAALEQLKEQQETPVWNRQPSPGQVNTLCIAPNCYKNCHVSCSLDFQNEPADLGRLCWAFHGSPTPVGGDKAMRCTVCDHKASEHRHYYHIHILEKRQMDPKTRKELEEAGREEEKLKAAKKLAQMELDTISEEINTGQGEIRRLVDEYNKVALSKNFAGHIQSAISMLELRKKELQSKQNTETDLKLIDESIAKFRQKLRVLQKEAQAMWDAASDKIKGTFSYFS